jgi:3alpha(or 20beta)-hydroxysteroid dehydrogenase
MVPGTAEHPDRDAFALAMEVNLLGPTLGTAACVPGMREAGGGSVVVVSSIAALGGGAGFLPYAMSKAAAVTYARCAARELGQYGVRVNALLPGGVETPMSTGPNFASLDRDAWFGMMPIPRIGRPDEVAAAVLYLASEESSFVTGTSLVVDGGQMHGPIARDTNTTRSA